MSRLEKLGFTPEDLRNAEVVELEPVKPKIGKKEKLYLADEVDPVLEVYAEDMRDLLLKNDALEAEIDEQKVLLQQQGEQLVAYQQNDAKLQNFENMMTNLEQSMSDVQQAKQQDSARIAQLQQSLQQADASLTEARTKAEELSNALATAEQNTMMAEARAQEIEAARKELDDMVVEIENEVNEVLNSLQERLREAGLIN